MVENTFPDYLDRVSSHLAAVVEVVDGGFVDPAGYERLVARHRPELTFLGKFSTVGRTLGAVLDRAADLGQRVILGGPALAAPHPTAWIEHRAIVSVVFGEADAVPAEDLLGASPHESVWVRGRPIPSRPAVLADVGGAPMPSRPGLEANGGPSARIATARGCPFGCDYCPLPLARRSTGLGWRPRSRSSLSGELTVLGRLGVRHVSLADESATGRHGLARLDLLADVISQQSMTWSAMLAPSALVGLDGAAARSLAERGLERAFLLLNESTGFRAGRLDARAAEVTDGLRAAGIDVNPGIITIDPYLTPSELLDRFEAVARFEPADPLAFVRPLSLQPGTRDHERYARLDPVVEPGPRAQSAGLAWRFRHRSTRNVIEDLLAVVDTAGVVDPAERSAMILERVERLRSLEVNS